MSPNRKYLKVASLLQVVVALAALILGITCFTGANYAEADAGVLGVLVVSTDGILYLLCAALSFITAFMGIHGANRPSALGSHRLLAVLTVLVGIVTCVVSGLGQTIPVLDALVILFGLIAAILDTMVRKELDR